MAGVSTRFITATLFWLVKRSRTLDLAEVIFVLAAQSPHKTSQETTNTARTLGDAHGRDRRRAGFFGFAPGARPSASILFGGNSGGIACDGPGSGVPLSYRRRQPAAIAGVASFRRFAAARAVRRARSFRHKRSPKAIRLCEGRSIFRRRQSENELPVVDRFVISCRRRSSKSSAAKTSTREITDRTRRS